MKHFECEEGDVTRRGAGCVVEDVNGMRSFEWGEEAEERGDVMIATVNKNYVGRKMALVK